MRCAALYWARATRSSFAVCGGVTKSEGLEGETAKEMGGGVTLGATAVGAASATDAGPETDARPETERGFSMVPKRLDSVAPPS